MSAARRTLHRQPVHSEFVLLHVALVGGPAKRRRFITNGPGSVQKAVSKLIWLRTKSEFYFERCTLAGIRSRPTKQAHQHRFQYAPNYIASISFASMKTNAFRVFRRMHKDPKKNFPASFFCGLL